MSTDLPAKLAALRGDARAMLAEHGGCKDCPHKRVGNAIGLLIDVAEAAERAWDGANPSGYPEAIEALELGLPEVE